MASPPEVRVLRSACNPSRRAGSPDSLLKLRFDFGEHTFTFFATSPLNFDCKCTSSSVFSAIGKRYRQMSYRRLDGRPDFPAQSRGT